MKRLIIILFTLHCSLLTLVAQAPQGFNYQAVARDGSGEPLANSAFNVTIGILSGTVSGPVIWEEEHAVNTNEMGLFTVMIGDPGATKTGGSAASFDAIDWSADIHFLKVQINPGGSYVDMGTTQLLSVPYALFSAQTANTDDDDADPGNELQDLSLSGNTLSLTGDATSVNLDTYLDDTNNWSKLGEVLYYNTGNVGIGTDAPIGRLEVRGNLSGEGSDPLFEVKRNDGQTVFAVYPDSVRVYINEAETKGTKGGFAVGGFNPATKAFTNEYLRVTPDSVRVYLNDDETKGTKGGFAVGGFNPAIKQGGVQDYLVIAPDSARIYVKDDLGTKGTKGGFAVGGFSPSKGDATHFMDITPNNYFIGHETGTKITESALYNSVMGYKAARNLSSGVNNTVIGYLADSSLTSGSNNIVIGASTGRNLTTGSHNTLIGYGAGLNHTSQTYNVMIGTTAGYNVTGSFNTFMGINAGYKIVAGTNNTFLGTNAGAMLEAGNGNTIIGIDAGRSGAWDPGTYHPGFSTSNNTIIGNRAGYNLNSGSGNVFIGYEAGFGEIGTESVLASNMLYVANSSANPPLVYGDFSTKKLGINTKTIEKTFNVGGDAFISGDLSAGSITAPVTGDVTGNVTGDVTGNVTGNVNGVETGKIYLTETNLVQSTASGTFQLIWFMEDGRLSIRNENITHPCSYWYNVYKPESPTAEEKHGMLEFHEYVLIESMNIDGTSLEIHFGQSHSEAGFCSVWLQYYKGSLSGHYTKSVITVKD